MVGRISEKQISTGKSGQKYIDEKHHVLREGNMIDHLVGL